jgi:hypothetical protein
MFIVLTCQFSRPLWLNDGACLLLPAFETLEPKLVSAKLAVLNPEESTEGECLDLRSGMSRACSKGALVKGSIAVVLSVWVI